MRSSFVDAALRCAALALAGWVVAGLTWGGLDLVRDTPASRSYGGAPVARAVPLARGAVREPTPAPLRLLRNIGGSAWSEGVPVMLVDGGVAVEVRAVPGTVLDLMHDVGLALGPLDRVETSLFAALEPGLVVRVVRGEERVETVLEALPAGATVEDDPALEIGQTRLVAEGREGSVSRTYRVRTEDGAVTDRQLLSELVVHEAVPARMARGTAPLALDTPAGRLYYSRSLDVLATYYTPANGGKSPDSPWYGITATGARATRGIVAVDPRVIPMYSWLYIPGYGVAQARDVGGAIIGHHIDVAFDDGDGAWWGRRYLTVFILAR